MSKKEALIALWRLLAELYDDKEKAKRLVEQSVVNPAHISADGAAADYWWRILLEAHKRGKVEEIVKNASWEIEERASDLKQAYRIYADAPDTGDLLEAPARTPGPCVTNISLGEGRSTWEMKRRSTQVAGPLWAAASIQAAVTSSDVT
jgi:hypothetical protein